jgi:hypothetical protein
MTSRRPAHEPGDHQEERRQEDRGADRHHEVEPTLDREAVGALVEMQQAHEPGFGHVSDRKPAERMLVELGQAEHLKLEIACSPGKLREHLGPAPTDSDQDEVRPFLAHDLLEVGESAEQPATCELSAWRVAVDESEHVEGMVEALVRGGVSTSSRLNASAPRARLASGGLQCWRPRFPACSSDEHCQAITASSGSESESNGSQSARRRRRPPASVPKAARPGSRLRCERGGARTPPCGGPRPRPMWPRVLPRRRSQSASRLTSRCRRPARRELRCGASGHRGPWHLS